MEFLQANWVWLLLMAGLLWLILRGGFGCGMSRRDDHAQRDRDLVRREPGTPGERPRADAAGEAEHTGHRGHRGC